MKISARSSEFSIFVFVWKMRFFQAYWKWLIFLGIQFIKYYQKWSKKRQVTGVLKSVRSIFQSTHNLKREQNIEKLKLRNRILTLMITVPIELNSAKTKKIVKIGTFPFTLKSVQSLYYENGQFLFMFESNWINVTVFWMLRLQTIFKLDPMRNDDFHFLLFW